MRIEKFYCLFDIDKENLEQFYLLLHNYRRSKQFICIKIYIFCCGDTYGLSFHMTHVNLKP